MRRVFAAAVLVALAACSSSSHVSQTVANIPKPDVVIVQRTNINESIPMMPTGINVTYEFQIANKAAVPITLKRIDFDALAGGGFEVQSKSRPYEVAIGVGEKISVDFVTTVYIDPRNYDSQAPVGVRAVLLFDSPEGSLRTVKQQRVSANSGN
jgi:predicted component of type VI protein secretion system